MTTKALREKRANIWSQAQEFAERAKAGETLSAEDSAAWERALADVDALKVQIDNLERTAALDTEFRAIDEQTTTVDARGREGTAADGEYREAFTQYLRFGLSELAPEQRQLLRANFQGQRAQGVGTGAGGGYTVPQGFWAKVTETMKYYGGVLAAGAEVINTDNGIDLPWPTNDDTSNTGALLAENTQIIEQDLSFGQKELGGYMYTSKLIRASLQFLQDAGIDPEAFIGRKAGERLGRIYNNHQTTGTGSSQPQGVITGATTGKTTAGATAITYNEIVDLIHSVDVAYRSAPPSDVAFMLHDLVLAYVRKIRDDSGGSGLGRPIWEPSVQVGVPDSLLGYRVVVNNDMASTVATTNKTIAFGNFRAGYVVRNINGGQLMRLEERYADYLQVGFFAFGRMDALVQDSSAVKLLVQA
jgi:HK97 family phage major capsid protein